MAKIEITQPPSGGGTVNTGVLQVLGGGAVTATTKTVTDQLGTLSALQVSTATVSVTPGGVLYGSSAILSVRGNTSSGGIAFEATNNAGTGLFQVNDGGQVNVNNKLAVGPVLSTPSDQTISLTTVASTDNLRNFVGKNISNTAGLQPFKVNAGGARGTSTTPTAVQTDDGLASFNGFGYNGTDWTPTRGGMYIYAAENWGLLANGTYITWRGAATGTTTVTEWARLQSTGLTISTIANATTDTDKFLVSDSGVIKYRTGAQVLSDIGAQSALTNPVTGTGTSNFVTFWTGTNTVSANSGLVYDNTTQRLGIGGVGPSTTLHVLGTTTTTGLIISTATAQTTTATQYLSLDAADSTVKYRTPAQVLSDIGAQATLTNPVTGTGAATRVAFWSSGSEISSSNTLNWDNTNKYLGINTASPVAQLQVRGNAAPGNNVARFETQSSVNLFTLSEEGKITAFAPQINALSGTTEINKFTSSFAASSAGSGSFRPLSIAYTINNTGVQTGTATGIHIQATETSLSGMAHNLINCQVGAVNVFSVSRTGLVTSLAGCYFNGQIEQSTSGGQSASFRGYVRVGNLGANTPSAVLDVDSTTLGFLPPRMTTTQKNAITTPATGLVVYDTTLNKLAVYTGAAWEAVTSV